MAKHATPHVTWRATLRTHGRLAVSLLLLVLFAVFATIPPIMLTVSSTAFQRTASDHENQVSMMSDQQIHDQLDSARAYNQRLYQDARNVYGEALDPVSGKSLSETDMEYLGQLTLPDDGIIATIDYPRLNITSIPVKHGTSDDTLASHAGHVYGTSLPVGGEHTHSVISAHTGLANRLMFDALSLRQANTGDVFYVTVLGQQMAYTVDRISIINPDDFTLFAATPGEDRVSLLTCTPYGLNTQRILVSGTRTAMPTPAPALKDAERGTDWIRILLILWVVLVWLFVLIIIIRDLTAAHLIRSPRWYRARITRHTTP